MGRFKVLVVDSKRQYFDHFATRKSLRYVCWISTKFLRIYELLIMVVLKISKLDQTPGF